MQLKNTYLLLIELKVKPLHIYVGNQRHLCLEYGNF